MSIEAMKQALEALEDWKTYMLGHWDVIDEQAITSLRQAIAEAEKQEPVGVVGMDVSGVHMTYGTQYLGQKPDTKTAILFKNLDVGTKLYTHPQPKQPLTDEQLRKVKHHMVDGAYHYSFMQGARYAEQYHGIKGEA